MNRIVQVDFDLSEYFGDEEDGCYIETAKGPGGWYVSVVVDCNSSGFVDDIVIDDGPYDSKIAAKAAGKNAAFDWCVANNVAYG